MALFGIQANIRRQRFLGKGGGGDGCYGYGPAYKCYRKVKKYAVAFLSKSIALLFFVNF